MMLDPEQITGRVLSANDGTVGAGWIVSSKQVITCAHVINEALGRSLEDDSQPEGEVPVIFPGSIENGAGSAVRCVVKIWKPVKKGSRGGYQGDIASLEAMGDRAYDLPQIRWIGSRKLIDASFVAFGFPKEPVQGRSAWGRIGSKAAHRIELIPHGNDKELPERGFSGAPVIVSGGVAGIVGSNLEVGSRAYMIPVDDFKELVPGATSLPAYAHAHPHLKYLDEALKEYDKRSSGQSFDLRAGLFNDLEAIRAALRAAPLDSYAEDHLNPAGFVKAITSRNGKVVLLSAPGGSGKTHFAIDVARQAFARGLIPFWLDLKKLRGEIKDLDQDLVVRKIFGECTISGDSSEFKKAAEKSGDDIWIFADRLNEYGGSQDSRDRLFEVLYQLTRAYPGVTLVASDRVSGLQPPGRLQWATLLPVSLDEMRASLRQIPVRGEWQRLLASPFFLALFLRLQSGDQSTGFTTRHEIFAQYFAEHVFKNPNWNSSKLGEAAFELYRRAAGPVAPEEDWQKAGFDNELLAPLTGASVVTRTKRGTQTLLEFNHQLLHDWCAAVHVAGLSEGSWTNDTFDVLTLNGASNDAIELVGEQLDSKKASTFLVRLYDWSWKGVLEAILNLEAMRHGGVSAVPRDLRDAFFALNALRVHDLFQHTRDAVRPLVDAYAKLEGALPLHECKDEAGVIELVRDKYPQSPSDSSLSMWRQIFLRESPADWRDLDVLAKDPLIGWTATNIMRIKGITREAAIAARSSFVALRAEASKSQTAVGQRWRIVHLFGAVNEEPWVQEFLLQVLFDKCENEWVRFGTVRSLLEQAAREKDPERRKTLLQLLTGRIGEINSEKIRSEFRRASIIAEPGRAPMGWYEDIEPIVAQGSKLAGTKDEGAWKEQLARIRQEKGRTAR